MHEARVQSRAAKSLRVPEAHDARSQVTERLAGLALVVVLAVTGCGSAGNDDAAAEPKSSEAGVVPKIPDLPPLMGEWGRDTTCQQRLEALEAVGLGKFAAKHAASEGWIPGVTSIKEIDDPRHPCAGAVPVKHSHFFTPDGLFGSRDAEGTQVDDGTFEIQGSDTVVVKKEFGDVTFRYAISKDDMLTLSPVLPACAKKGCFAAQWAVAMAYPGLPWSRVDRYICTAHC